VNSEQEDIPDKSGFLPALPTGRQAAGWSSVKYFTSQARKILVLLKKL
jgi:hypothetical protein